MGLVCNFLPLLAIIYSYVFIHCHPPPPSHGAQIKTCLELSAAVYPTAFWTSTLGSWTCLTQLTVYTCFSCILITWNPAIQTRNPCSSLSFTTALKSSPKSYQFPLRNLPQSVPTPPFLVTLP